MRPATFSNIPSINLDSGRLALDHQRVLTLGPTRFADRGLALANDRGDLRGGVFAILKPLFEKSDRLFERRDERVCCFHFLRSYVRASPHQLVRAATARFVFASERKG